MLQIALKSRFKSDLRRRLLAWECFLCSSFHSCFGLFIFFLLQLAGVVPPTEMRTLKQSFCCGNLMRTILRDIFFVVKERKHRQSVFLYINCLRGCKNTTLFKNNNFKTYRPRKLKRKTDEVDGITVCLTVWRFG